MAFEEKICICPIPIIYLIKCLSSVPITINRHINQQKINFFIPVYITMYTVNYPVNFCRRIVKYQLILVKNVANKIRISYFSIKFFSLNRNIF